MKSYQLISSSPLVSVIIPAYNAEKFIGKTLASVLTQTYRNLEIIVIDDGSQDQTPQIVEAFAQKHACITLLRQPNQGVAAARNLGIEKSQGEYIAPLDADDIWHPQKIEKQVQCFLEADLSVGLVYAWSVGIDEEDLLRCRHSGLTIEGDVLLPLVYFNLISTSSTPLIRRLCLEQVGHYNCQFKAQNAQGCEDWDLYLRLAEYYQFRVVPEVLIGYRRVISSMSSDFTSMVKSMSLTMSGVQERNPKIPNYLFRWSFSNFCRYLAGNSQGSSNHKRTLFWIYKSLQTDYINYLDYKLYARILITFAKLIVQPIASLIWSDHFAWEKYRKKFKSQTTITLEDVKDSIYQPQQDHWNFYQRVRKKRVLFLQNYQMIANPETKRTSAKSREKNVRTAR